MKYNLFNRYHSEEEADLDSIAFICHEGVSPFYSLQQMDAKKPEVVEELKLKYGEGRMTEDEFAQNVEKKLTAIPMMCNNT